jgi:hypothetical protein
MGVYRDFMGFYGGLMGFNGYTYRKMLKTHGTPVWTMI